MKRLIGTAALALMIAGCGGSGDNSQSAAASGNVALTNVPPPAGTQWTDVVEKTAEGGFRMGNPNAKVKLIEFGSRSCPHCAKFDEDSGALRTKYVASGSVSYEFRDFMIHPQDPAAAVLGQCGGPQPFFAMLDQMFADQPNSFARLDKLPPDASAQIQGKSAPELVAWWAENAGYLDFVKQRGISEEKARSCLADQKGLEALVAGNQRDTAQYNISGTPTFVVNGKTVDGVNDWAGLEPVLKGALQ
ncbi:MAG: DsbA family protein [Alphaproteobacteria bacterium]|nr:MAG: DsbA family protein [Alphaproteobacteria bacterium]